MTEDCFADTGLQPLALNDVRYWAYQIRDINTPGVGRARRVLAYAPLAWADFARLIFD